MMLSKKLLAALCLGMLVVASMSTVDARHHHKRRHNKKRWNRKPKYSVKKTDTDKVTGDNDNKGVNRGEMTNWDKNYNSAGAYQSGHITGHNVGTNSQGNYQSVTANPMNTQHTMITSNPVVGSTNMNDNKETKNVRRNSPNKHVKKTYKKKHGHYKRHCRHCRG